MEKFSVYIYGSSLIIMKRVCKVYSLNDRFYVEKRLEERNIKYKSKAKGVRITSLYSEKIYWFIIYVQKSDYERAKSIINELPHGYFKKNVELL